MVTPKKKREIPVTFQANEDMIEALDKIATAEDRSRSAVLRRLVMEAIEKAKAA